MTAVNEAYKDSCWRNQWLGKINKVSSERTICQIIPITNCTPFQIQSRGTSDPKQTRDRRAKLNYIISGLLCGVSDAK